MSENKKLHICMITSAPMPPEEGIGVYIYNLSQKLIKAGCLVSILTRGHWRHFDDVSTIDGITVHRVRYAPLYPFHVHFHHPFVKKCIEEMRPKPDLIHLHSPLPPPIKTDIPTVVTIHTPMKADVGAVKVRDMMSLLAKFQMPVSCILEKKMMRNAAVITTPANRMAEELQDYGIDTTDIIVTGNGVDTDLFKPGEKATTNPFVLYTGRLGYRKGLIDLLDCAKALSTEYPELTFLIVGKGPMEPILRDRIAKMGLENTVQLYGYIPHTDRHKLIKLYQEALIHIQPSHYEAVAATMLEAMACGTPVVATATGGLLDAVKDQKNGLLVPVGDIRQMATAIGRLLKDSALRIKLGQEARKTVETCFSWDVICSRFQECYKKATVASRGQLN